MRAIKLAVRSLRMSLSVNVVFVLLTAILLSVVNILIGAINNQTMLYTPYEKYLTSDGYYIIQNSYPSFHDEAFYTKDILPETGELLTLNANEYVKSELEGDLQVILAYSCSNYGWDCYVIEDEIYDSLTLPLSSGRKTKNIEDVLASANGIGIGTGDKITTVCSFFDEDTNRFRKIDKDVNVSGILTDTTYAPWANYTYMKTGVQLFFTDYNADSSGKNGDNPFYIIRKSFAVQNDMQVGFPSSAIFYYDSKPSDEVYESNLEKIRLTNNVIELSVIDEQARETLGNAYARFLPLALVAFVIMFVGFVCNVSLQTIRGMKRYSVYLLCGAGKSKISLINLISIIITLLCSLAICGTVIFVLENTSISALLGTAFGRANVLITFALSAICCLFSYILTVIIISKRKPAELIRSEQK